MRALVIDDHPLIHEIMPAVLRKALGEVTVATQATLEAGLARAAGSVPPDLVLLDLGLPGCEGIDALTRFRLEFPQLPVVVLSANSRSRIDPRRARLRRERLYPEDLEARGDDRGAQAGGGGRGLRAAGSARGAGRCRCRARTRGESMELTERQREVLRLILKGYNNERIAVRAGDRAEHGEAARARHLHCARGIERAPKR